MKRYSPFAELATVCALAVLVLAPPTSEATPPGDFDPLVASLKTFTGVDARVAFNYPDDMRGVSRNSLRFLVDPSGDFAADERGGLVRLSWDGNVFQAGHGVGNDAFVREDSTQFGVIWGDLYPEIRSGFAQSTWTVETPAQGGLPVEYPANISWARIDLPFDWASDHPVYLGVLEKNLRLRHVVVSRGPGMEPIQASVTQDVDWAWTHTTADLAPEAPGAQDGWDLDLHRLGRPRR